MRQHSPSPVVVLGQQEEVAVHQVNDTTVQVFRGVGEGEVGGRGRKEGGRGEGCTYFCHGLVENI